MPNMPITPVLLSGGSGTRLWPVSRQLYPKQLLPLVTGRSMIQETALRFTSGGALDFAAPLVVCNEEHRFTIAAQLNEIGIPPGAMVLEPFGRNTAPAAAVAALLVERQAPDSLVLLSPADHHVSDLPAFLAAISAGVGPALDGLLVTFGIVPDRAETGYGYIRRGPIAGVHAGAFAVDAFVEKPDPETAKRYVNDGYLWNSGIFLFRSSALLEEMGRLAPEILDAAGKTLDKAAEDLDFLRLDRESFAVCPSDSLDYAVMERTEKAAVVPAEMGWNDIGSWASLWLSGERDDAGNLLSGDVMAMDTADCLIRSESRLVAAYGVRDLVIVETPDAVLVASRDEAQHVKAIVSALKEKKRSEADAHQRVYRPWGYFEGVHDGDRYQVKHLMVNPGATLSLQMHYHRAEHWVVVQGTAKVTVGEETKLLSENESVYIPIGSQHRLENPGKVPLSIIEVQSGAYLGEDDIVRFEDVYKRT